MDHIFDCLQELHRALKPYNNDRNLTQLKHSMKRAANAIATKNMVEEALEDLYAAVPRQTKDADWWDDRLTAAMKNADKALDQIFEPSNSNS